MSPSDQVISLIKGVSLSVAMPGFEPGKTEPADCVFDTPNSIDARGVARPTDHAEAHAKRESQQGVRRHQLQPERRSNCQQFIT